VNSIGAAEKAGLTVVQQRWQALLACMKRMHAYQ
jgi:hypothetical protein